MDRKNTLLLTVIAIATLLVAVVGATFAFFTAQNTGKGETEINVKTETTTSVVFDKGEPIDITANMSNFTQDDINGDQQAKGTMDTTNSSVTLTGASTTGADAKDKVCYSATLKVYKNTFEYNPTDMSAFASKKAELLLVVKKTKNGVEEAKEYTATEIPDDESTHKYVTNVSEYYGNEHQFATTYANVKGFDITTLGKTETNSCVADEQDDYWTCETPLSFKLPIFTDEDVAGSASDDTKKYIHVLEAKANETVSDKWEVTVYFLNHDEAQNYNSAGKRFSAKFVLESVNCDTGESTAVTP